MNDVQGLLFDGDGTLIDTYDMILQSMRRILNDGEGMDLSEAELMVGVGTPLLDQMLHFTKMCIRDSSTGATHEASLTY